MDRLALMETFAAVVRLGNYSQAAKELGVTRALVSRRVQDLEAVLKVKLLNRNTHQLSLTGIGADYYERCTSLLGELRTLEESMQETHDKPHGELNVLVPKTFGEAILAPIIATFCRHHPTISVNATLGDTDVSPYGMDLMAGGFDLAIRTLPTRDSSLIARPIPPLPRMLVAAPDYLRKKEMPRAPADLAKFNCMDPSGAEFFNWTFKGPTGLAAVRVSGLPRSNSSAVLRHAALKGLGIAVLREYLVADDLRRRNLIQILPAWQIDERKLYFIYQKARHQPIGAKIFIDYAIGRIKDMTSSGQAHETAKASPASAPKRESAV
jgi:DNA-binding transcriptional LysR family regulator